MPYKWQALIAVCFGTYMATMDFSIVNVALPTLSREFNRAPDTVVWATLVSSLVVTGLTLTAGRTGDLFGRKRIYIGGWVIFTIGMGVASFAQSIEQLIAFRFFQSVGVAMAIANGNAIVTDAFPDNERGRALGTTGAVVGAGLMSGPILGGLILSLFEWQALFYLRVPIGLIAMTMAIVFIRDTPGQPAGSRKMDIPGAVALFFTLSSTLLAVNRGPAWGWTSPVILGLFAVGLTSFLAFLRIESLAASPVVSLALFKMRNFAVSVSSLMLNFAGQSAVTFLMPFYLINVRDYTTAQTGLILATVPSMMLLLSPVSGLVSDRYGFRYQVTAGIALVTLGLFSLSTIGPATSTGLIMARLAVVGIGTSVFMSPNSATIMGSVPRTMLGTASASVATSRNVGNAVGLAMASAILVGVASASAGLPGVRTDALPPEALLDGIRVAFIVAGSMSALAIAASSFRGRQPRKEAITAGQMTATPVQAGGTNRPD